MSGNVSITYYYNGNSIGVFSITDENQLEHFNKLFAVIRQYKVFLILPIQVLNSFPDHIVDDFCEAIKNRKNFGIHFAGNDAIQNNPAWKKITTALQSHSSSSRISFEYFMENFLLEKDLTIYNYEALDDLFHLIRNACFSHFDLQKSHLYQLDVYSLNHLFAAIKDSQNNSFDLRSNKLYLLPEECRTSFLEAVRCAKQAKFDLIGNYESSKFEFLEATCKAIAANHSSIHEQFDGWSFCVNSKEQRKIISDLIRESKNLTTNLANIEFKSMPAEDTIYFFNSIQLSNHLTLDLSNSDFTSLSDEVFEHFTKIFTNDAKLKLDLSRSKFTFEQIKLLFAGFANACNVHIIWQGFDDLFEIIMMLRRLDQKLTFSDVATLLYSALSKSTDFTIDISTNLRLLNALDKDKLIKIYKLTGSKIISNNILFNEEFKALSHQMKQAIFQVWAQSLIPSDVFNHLPELAVLLPRKKINLTAARNIISKRKNLPSFANNYFSNSNLKIQFIAFAKNKDNIGKSIFDNFKDFIQAELSERYNEQYIACVLKIAFAIINKEKITFEDLLSKTDIRINKLLNCFLLVTEIIPIKQLNIEEKKLFTEFVDCILESSKKNQFESVVLKNQLAIILELYPLILQNDARYTFKNYFTKAIIKQILSLPPDQFEFKFKEHLHMARSNASEYIFMKSELIQLLTIVRKQKPEIVSPLSLYVKAVRATDSKKEIQLIVDLMLQDKNLSSAWSIGFYQPQSLCDQLTHYAQKYFSAPKNDLSIEMNIIRLNK